MKWLWITYMKNSQGNCVTQVSRNSYLQELAAKKGMASTVDVNLHTSLLSNHTKLSSKVGNEFT